LKPKSNSRIVTLDWLRGLMAIAIMFYHLSDFTITREQPLDASDVLGRLGIYGVSIFFILSGLSMALVYNNYFKDRLSAINFYFRRIFRIWPLFWLVIILKVTFTEYIVGEAHYSLLSVFLNLTTLFGFVKPTAYIALGAWSIGNEMVYYALTPIIIMVYSKNVRAGNLLFIAALATGILFSTALLDARQLLAQQWAVYVNPFNNFFLYMMGIAMYYNLNTTKINQYLVLILLIVSLSLFCILPFQGDLINLVTGAGRMTFVLISFTIVFCFYKMEITLPEIISRFFESFGAATYGIYLLHPIIYIYTIYFFNGVSKNHINVFLIVVPATIIISLVSYNYFESRLVKLGKRITFKRKLIE
jgi:exopolysaccharide production protein ExoZ